jgi:predicted O-methyltransferase YrrM
MAKTFLADDRLYDYVLSSSLREPELLRRLREETASHPRAIMQIAPDQGQLFGLLIQLLQAKKALEIGVFTGYSSLCVALALPDDGKLVACDISEEYTSVARRYWKEAGVAHKIDLEIGPAADTLRRLLDEGQEGTFDFAFIDADKTGYDTYYELALRLLRRGGLIALDNVLFHGGLIDPAVQDNDTVALRELNRKLLADERVTISMLSISDGITLALKR